MASVANEKEIIFPEIGAIVTGAVLAPKMPWTVNKKRIFISLLVCGILGMAVVRCVPLCIELQMIMGYFIALLVVKISKTTFMPMISALVLPILLQTRSVWYLFSLILFTVTILLIRYLLEKYGIKEKNEYLEVSEKTDLRILAFRMILVSVMIILSLRFDFRYAVAPPLLVAFTEFSSVKNKVVETMPVKIILLAGLCAVSGAWIRLMGERVLGSSLEPQIVLVASVIISGLLFLMIVNGFNVFIPPFGAIVLLAYLIPKDYEIWYPMHILSGITVYIIITKAYKRISEKSYNGLF
ncbi:MAG: hypothetical protein K6G84_01765 [Lachnospiraceae bacterium]|nr:hypothetical protein [Lachnospiraceae bacterium]